MVSTKIMLKLFYDIMCTTPPLFTGGWMSCQIFKKGVLTGPQFLEGGCWEKGGNLFQEGCSFYIKNKLKSEIFNDKKFYEQKCFSLS